MEAKYDYSWLDRPTLERFKLAYQTAVQAKQETFYFTIPGHPGEHEVLASFAKYLIEWRESVLKREGR